MNSTFEQIQAAPPPAGSLIASIPCPNAYLAYPEIQHLADIPAEVVKTLDPIWRRSIQRGRTVNVYHVRDVFVTAEGLVFSEGVRLIDVTRTYHNDVEVMNGFRAVSSAINLRSAPTLERGILTKSRGAKNYGHFLIEMLPRAWLARNHIGMPGWPAVVDCTSASVFKVASQALLQAGFSTSEIAGTTDDPVFVQDLVIVDGLTSHSQYLSPIALQCIDAIAETIPAGTGGKIYAERRPATVRDFENEREIAIQLNDAGYVTACPAEMSFTDQVSTFKGAQSVIAVAGAALTNIVFCNPGTRVLNFVPSTALEVLFWMISEVRRLKYLEVRCREVGPQMGPLPWDRAIRIGPRELRRVLNQDV